MNQTAVEWYAKQLARIGVTEELIGHLTKEAKQIEKEQMIQFAENMRYVSNNIETSYNETYKNTEK